MAAQTLASVAPTSVDFRAQEDLAPQQTSTPDPFRGRKITVATAESPVYKDLVQRTSQNQENVSAERDQLGRVKPIEMATLLDHVFDGCDDTVSELPPADAEEAGVSYLRPSSSATSGFRAYYLIVIALVGLVVGAYFLAKFFNYLPLTLDLFG